MACRRWRTPARHGRRSSRLRANKPNAGRRTGSRWLLWRRAARGVPIQRLGEVEEYGWLVALLATPLGRALSGSVVTLDGGLDNWPGPWPPEELTSDGAVPTEARRPSAAGSSPSTD